MDSNESRIQGIITIGLILLSLFLVLAGQLGYIDPTDQYCIQQVQFESQYQMSDAEAREMCGE